MCSVNVAVVVVSGAVAAAAAVAINYKEEIGDFWGEAKEGMGDALSGAKDGVVIVKDRIASYVECVSNHEGGKWAGLKACYGDSASQ